MNRNLDETSVCGWFTGNKHKILMYCQVEEALKEMHFLKTSIFRPGVLDRGDKSRFVERAYGKFINYIEQ